MANIWTISSRAKKQTCGVRKKNGKGSTTSIEAISQQDSEELDIQLPSKLSRFQDEMDSRDSNMLVIPKSSHTELKQSTSQQHIISQHALGEITERPISTGSAFAQP